MSIAIINYKLTMNYQELKIQSDIVLDFNHKYPQYRGLLFSINNNATDGKKGSINKSAGVVAGVSDMCLILTDMRVIWIEVKTSTGKQSENQIKWQSKVENINHIYIIVRSLEDFYKQISKWIEL